MCYKSPQVHLYIGSTGPYGLGVVWDRVGVPYGKAARRGAARHGGA